MREMLIAILADDHHHCTWDTLFLVGARRIDSLFEGSYGLRRKRSHCEMIETRWLWSNPLFAWALELVIKVVVTPHHVTTLPR